MDADGIHAADRKERNIFPFVHSSLFYIHQYYTFFSGVFFVVLSGLPIAKTADNEHSNVQLYEPFLVDGIRL